MEKLRMCDSGVMCGDLVRIGGVVKVDDVAAGDGGLIDVDFSDFEASKAWFETQSPTAGSLVASRAALRVLANISLIEPGAFEELALVSFRTVLISAVRGIGRTADMEAAAATFSADSVFRSATFSAHSAVSMDAQQVQDALRLGALWQASDVPSAIAENHKVFLGLLGQDTDWSFWRDWYVAMWDGTFEDWDLAHEVAKIEGEVWEGEDALAQVAARIREIEAEHLTDRAGIDETLVFDRSTLTFEVKPHLQSNKDVLNVAVERVEDALDDVLALGKGNGLTKNTLEARILLRLFRKYTQRPELT
jgi:hypothetical protein